jgi:hypothetical protein
MSWHDQDQLSLFQVDETHLYFQATSDGMKVKVGISTNIPKRQRDLQTGNPQDLITMGAYPGIGETIEIAVHDYFAELHLRGEWFIPKTPEFKLVALGEGLPLPVYEQYQDLRARVAGDLAALQQDKPSIQDAVTAHMQSETHRQSVQLNKEILKRITGSLGDSYFYSQPVIVAIEQIWTARLNGTMPFAVGSADIAPSSWRNILNGDAK